jgi:hypothetical protein
MVWDPGSGIRDPGFEIRDPEKTYSGFRISDPGVKKAPDPGSWISDPDPQHCKNLWKIYSLAHGFLFFAISISED